MSEVDNSGWYALVKYKSGNETEVLPVHKIKVKIRKGERVAFNPKSLTDFEKTKFYTVNTAHGSKDGKEHKWYALIGLLAESREALEHAIHIKRISWPILFSENESKPNLTDDASEQANMNSCNMTIISNRDLTKNRKKTKKDATDAIHAKLLSFRNLNSNNTCDASVSVADDEDIVQRLRENEELKSSLKAQRNNSPKVVRDYTDIFQEYLQKIETKIEEMQENFQKKLDHAGKVNLEKFAELERNITNVGDSIRMRPPLSSTSSASTSEVSSDTEKVPLGDGVFCSKAAYTKLINVEESHADWAYALLKGVFGEKAHLMRVRIRNKHTENEKFPSNFLMVAKSLHRDWLVKQKIWDKNGQLHSKYSTTEVEKYVNALPAYLADRAYDMQGPRGVNMKRRDGNLDNNAPQRRRSGPTDLKRKYTRRGQSQLQIMQQLQRLPHLQQNNNQQPLPSQQSLLQQQLPQQLMHQEPPLQQQSSQLSLQHQQPLSSQQPLSQQLFYQELPPQQQSSQSSLQPFDFLNIPPSTSRATTFENLQYDYYSHIHHSLSH